MQDTLSSACPESPEDRYSHAGELRELASELSPCLEAVPSMNLDEALRPQSHRGTFLVHHAARQGPVWPQEQQRRSRSSSSASNNDINNSSNNNNNNNAPTNAGMRPWVLILIFSIVQMILSATFSTNGVSASTNQASNSETNNGGSGNSAKGGDDTTTQPGSNHNHQPYFRVLPRISNPSTAPGKIVSERMTDSRRLLLRQEAKDMFLHGYHGYLNYAFPKDELNPVTCSGRGPDRRNPHNININDVLGDFSLTLIDALDTLALMREPERFRQAIQLVKRYVGNFNIDSRVQVFEVNIRVLGALLSGHIYASDPRYKSLVEGYKGELLIMAEDLGRRLLKAFENSPTGIPWPRVNLKRGVLKSESPETCAAGAGSLLLEFGTLSRLTGDKSFEEAARKALFELWDRRSNIGLIGNTINITTGQWMSAMTGIGAGTDSFYEYLLKSYVLLGEDTYLDMYEDAQESIRRNLLHDSKYFYKHVHIEDGSLLAGWVDSLSAFMPGVQVLGGDLESAIKNHLYYYNIWRKYQAIPERFNFITQAVDISNYPLRPEFIESNYFLYRATKDAFYLEVGEMILRDLQTYTKTKCGWSSLKSVIDKKLEDRMESFALSETFKYLFLLFDEENVLHRELKDTNFVFTTEGHVLSLESNHLDKYKFKHAAEEAQQHSSSSTSTFRHRYPRSRSTGSTRHLGKRAQQDGREEDKVPQWPTCAPYRAPGTFLKSIPYRTDADFARQMVGVREDARDVLELDPKGFCEKPTLEVERVVVEFVGPPKKTVFEDDDDLNDDDTQGVKKLDQKKVAEESKELLVIPVKKGVFVNRIVGVKMQLQYDDTHNGYRAIKVADHPLSLNCNVYIEQSSMQPLWDSYQRSQDAHLRIFKSSVSESSPSSTAVTQRDLSIKPAEFGYWRPSVLDYSQDSSSSVLQTHERQPKEHTNGGNEVTGDDDGMSSQQSMGSIPSFFSFASSSSPNKPRRIPARKLIRIDENERGCRPFTTLQSERIRDKILVVNRGACLFILKAYYAQAAGAHGVVIINSDETTFTMTGPSSDSSHPDPSQSGGGGGSGSAGTVQIGEGILEDVIDIHAVMVGRSEGQLLLDWIKEVETTSFSSNSSAPSPNDKDVKMDADKGEEPVAQLRAGFIQRKVTKEQLANARLSYNSLPIVNVFPIDVPIATYG